MGRCVNYFVEIIRILSWSCL